MPDSPNKWLKAANGVQLEVSVLLKTQRTGTIETVWFRDGLKSL